MTPICVPIFVTDAATAIPHIRAAQNAGAGMIELRCDTADRDAITTTVRFAEVPVIVTIRPTWEGGKSTATDEERLTMFRAALAAGANLIDIEWVAWQRTPAFQTLLPQLRERHARLILSNHDFEGRPADLDERVKQMCAIDDVNIVKIVWRAADPRDARIALELTRHATAAGKALVALAMGEAGQLSRLLAGKVESPFTFAALPAAGESAPGQPALDALTDLYRLDDQSYDWPTYAVIGWPVRHSLSPLIHNRGLARANLPGVYVPLPIAPTYDAFAAVLDDLRASPTINLRGLSVTIPHKENALRYITERGGTIDPLAARIGAVNTIAIDQHNALTGSNSDYAGALDALTLGMGITRNDLAGKRIAVLGAGGAARAIVAGLSACGATVVIYNRTQERAAALAAAFTSSSVKVVAAAFDNFCKSCCTIAINCTPLGMHPNVDASPLTPADLDGLECVMDTIYTPRDTRLLQDAASKNIRVIPGVEMFIRQAAAQFTAFTAHAAPVETFRAALAL
jgi:3-dehydroquinate dehydratase/shikimate dehydrogenase